MSAFEVKVVKISAIESIEGCDNIELAVVGDYRSVVRKNQFKASDLAVYIPESSICPTWLLQKIGLVGKLAGPNKNRVKAAKFRGCLSQGIVVPVQSPIDFDGEYYYTDGTDGYLSLEDGSRYEIGLGEDVAEVLGIEKYSPPIPVHMAGEVFNAHGFTLSYDIENIKKYPDTFVEGEEVVMTEKLHGTWTCLGYNSAVGKVVTSKGISGQGLAFKFNEANEHNLYMRSLKSTTIDGKDVIERACALKGRDEESFYILGETFGKGVQDLHYGTDKPQFRVFDVYVGEPGQGHYLNYVELVDFCAAVNVEMVPLVYRGPYSKAKLLEMTNGTETFSGKGANIREGVVVKSSWERYNEVIGRVQLKSVSDDYLLRKGNSTEFN